MASTDFTLCFLPVEIMCDSQVSETLTPRSWVDKISLVLLSLSRTDTIPAGQIIG